MGIAQVVLSHRTVKIEPLTSWKRQSSKSTIFCLHRKSFSLVFDVLRSRVAFSESTHAVIIRMELIECSLYSESIQKCKIPQISFFRYFEGSDREPIGLYRLSSMEDSGSSGPHALLGGRRSLTFPLSEFRSDFSEFYAVDTPTSHAEKCAASAFKNRQGSSLGVNTEQTPGSSKAVASVRSL